MNKKYRQAARQAQAASGTLPIAAPLDAPQRHASHASATIERPSLAIFHTASGDLALRDTTNHIITIPKTLDGLRLLDNLLSIQELAIKRKSETTIGTNAKPIQQMVDAFLKNRELEKEIQIEKEFETLKELF